MLSIQTAPAVPFDDTDEDATTATDLDETEDLSSSDTIPSPSALYGGNEFSFMDMELLRAMASAVYVPDPLATDSDSGSTLAEVPVPQDAAADARQQLEAVLKVEDATEEHFTAEEFGSANNIRLYDEKVATEATKFFLFSKMRPRQFFIGNIMYREREARKVTWDELFMDLVFVGALAKTGHIVRVSSISPALLNQFTLVFSVVWMSYILIQHQINRFGLQGFGSRLIYWVYMVLVAALGVNAAHVWDDDKGASSANLFVAVYLVLRGMYCAVHASVLVSFPKFGTSIGSLIAGTSVSTVPYLVSLFFGKKERVYLWWIGFAMDTFLFPVAIFVSRFLRIGGKNALYRISVNIEHHTERFCCFTMAILGEMAIALLWPSSYRNMSVPYAATILGLIITTSYQWLYFNIDRLFMYTHAIRRSAVTAVLWQVLHFPFHLALITSSGPLAYLILSTKDATDAGVAPTAPPDASIRIVWFTSLALALVISAGIGMTHKNHDHHVRLPKKYRAVLRCCVAAVFAVCAGVTSNLGTMGVVVIPAALLLALVVVEEYGRMNNPKYKGEHHHHHHHHHRKAHHQTPTPSPPPPADKPYLIVTEAESSASSSVALVKGETSATLVSDASKIPSKHVHAHDAHHEHEDFKPAPCMRKFVEESELRNLEAGASVPVAPGGGNTRKTVRKRRSAAKFAKLWHGQGGGAAHCF
ncbi:hypothetical protein HDU96_008329 [Phlyctochytrium bullatum]|nr:hypothetical protein HDU96_008329 [Phlyctochytrium bullatum]